MIKPVQILRDLLAKSETQFIPTCYDALSARLVHGAGFKLCLMSGYGVAATRLGFPDIGLATQSELVDQLRNICGAVPGFPVIGDADTGYGNALNVRRTVLEYARAGAAGLMIEDQVSPKRCGHFEGKQVISRDEAKMKIRAAIEARNEAKLDIVIGARTDARSVLGFEAALERCFDFQNEGADILFMEALEAEDEMRDFCTSVQTPTLGNNFPGGKTPYLGREKLREIGFKIVTDPTLLFTAVRAIRDHLTALAADDPDRAPPKVSFEEMKTIIGMPEYDELEMRYKAPS